MMTTRSVNDGRMPSHIEGLPNLCGSEELIARTLGPEGPTAGVPLRVRAAGDRRGPFYFPDSKIDFDRIHSAFAIALHMHQPLIPAGGEDLRTARIISNLEHMMNHPHVGDNHNAPVFRRCYQRMGEFIPQLVHAGKQPRIMLDYSGCLLHGLCQMGAEDVIDSLRTITCDPTYRPYVEWLGTAWSHPVAPSTPVQDFRLHVQAWQHFFAALFGLEALSRVRGFSPCEMALPNHPDVCYEFVRTLKDCGYRWVLVQEHTVERVEDTRPHSGPSDRAVRFPHQPHRLVARNSSGEVLSITAIIKTQGSDTKLVGQMQPYYEARNLARARSDAVRRSPDALTGTLPAIPPLVTQIADGENGGVMMNEFPPKYFDVMAEASASQTPPVNVSEYLEYLESLGITEDNFPAIQPVMQQHIWDRFAPGAGPEALEQVIADLRKENHHFHMEGGSWTNNLSWVRGYEHTLGPMQAASALFAQKVLSRHVATSDPRYRNALFHLLASETSCFRYWGEGLWTEYGRELCRRTIEILERDF